MSCGIVIPSCDGYSGCWEVLRHSFDRYWVDREYPEYLISNFKDSPFNTIKVGAEKSWGDLLLGGLREIPHQIVILLLDDYWFREPVDSGLLRRCVEFVGDGTKQIRLYKSDDSEDCGVEGFRHIRDDSETVHGITASVWDRDYLIGAVRDTDSIWDVNKFSRERRTSSMNFCVEVPPIKIFSLWICRYGKFTGDAIEYCDREGLELPKLSGKNG